MSPITPPNCTEPRTTATYRILLVDDNPAIHEDFKKILYPSSSSDARTNDIEALLFGAPVVKNPQVDFQLDSAYQGQEALRMLNDSLAEGRPYALAFVDVRMPPGWDGIETVNRLWEIYPGLQVVICTAYSDYSWEQMRATLKHPDSLVVLKKPFDNVEVQQLAHALARKWELNVQAVIGIQQLDKNIRRLLSTSHRSTETSANVDDDLPSEMVNSCDGLQFVNALVRLSEAVDSTRRQLRLAEQKLVQSEKMASLGNLSAGIIHEINNPLNYAMAALSLLESDSKHIPEHLREDHVDALKDMREGLSRVSNITGSLRKFAHPESSEAVEVRVNDCVTTSLRLMAAELKDGITVRNEIPEDLTVWAAGSKLSQVFINLIHNAAHALRAKKFQGEEKPEIVFEALCDEEHVTIRVTDNGTGIPTSVIDSIFDPFFTTKDVGQGTGLGLGICHQILKGYNATIQPFSQEGEFTCFDLVFQQPQSEWSHLTK